MVRPAAQLAIEGKGEMRPGEWCAKTYCKFRDRCKARADHYQRIYEEHRGRELSNEELGQLLPVLDAIKKWSTEIQEGALSEILTGGTIPGWKAVEGRSARKITDQEGLAETLLEEGFDSELIYKPLELKGITDLEKLVGKKNFSSFDGRYIEKPPGKPTLAPEHDKRPAINDVESELTFD